MDKILVFLIESDKVRLYMTNYFHIIKNKLEGGDLIFG